MKRIFAALAVGSALSGTVPGAESVDYARDVKPILAKHCASCHGPVKPRGGLRLDTAAAAVKGGKSGPAVVPGESEESLLIEALTGDGAVERMPLKRPPLSDREVATLRAWIDQGARFPAGEKPGKAPPTHWAFVPPVRTPAPVVKHGDWVRNPVDRFVLARLEREKLAPSAEADRATLIRRVSLDLLGLPPEPSDVEAFLADTDPGAYDRLVDRLLASPHYGERWGRLWLDQARYADSNGYSIDAPRSIWKYRDWVIDALNRDMPFDQFSIDQLAGDLRPNASLEQKVATGFHRNTLINQEGGIDPEQFRVDAVVDRVATTATVFLGLTMACAQCHDHKYDPITQREYYQLFAFFNNTDEPEVEFGTPADFGKRAAVRTRIAAFHKKLKSEHPEVASGEREWEKSLSLDFRQAQSAEIKDAFDRPIDTRTESQWQGLTELYLASQPKLKELHREVAALRKREPRFVTSMVVRERTRPRETHVHIGGDFTRKGTLVTPGVPGVLHALQASTPPDRMDLARWLVDPRNPVTARVTVNRLWQAYFGRGLVETENDFGTQGTPPSHPELLDWLATELVARGWSLKATHRLVVTSATYRQSSKARPELAAIDPGNRLLARQSRLRLDAELIRDSALAASGLLARKVGGPSVFPPQPDGVMKLGQMKRPWNESPGEDRYRRGLYTFFWRATPYPALIVFDAPNGTQTCTRRIRSNTPLQALTLLNDQAFVELARALGDRIIHDAPADDDARARHAFRLCLAREPRGQERETIVDLVRQERGESGRDDRRAELAAWTAAARVLLNLDEFITRE
jgi:mono/diheme cytochrome c family protein